MTNYRRRTEKIVIPYPYLTEDTVIAIEGIPNIFSPAPAVLAEGQWYKFSQTTVINLQAGRMILVANNLSGSWRIVWDTAPVNGTHNITVTSGEYAIILNSQYAILTLAGFPVLRFQESDPDTGVNPGFYVQFASNIYFDFVQASN